MERTITAIIIGTIGTLGMTLFIEFVCRVFNKPFHVVKILQRMMMFGKSLSPRQQNFVFYPAAVILHYTIGVFFSYAYVLGVKSNLINLDWLSSLMFGAAAGLIGIIGWRIFFALHPTPPPKINLAQYLLTIWLGHLVFALTQFYVYLKLLPTPTEASIPTC